MVIGVHFITIVMLCITVCSTGLYSSYDKLNKKLIKKVKNKNTFDSTIQSLLKKKADPNAVDENGITAFYHLLCHDEPSLKKVMLFLDHKVDCNKTTFTPMHEEAYPLQCLSGRVEQNKDTFIPLIKLLLRHKANPNMINQRKCTLLHEIINSMSCCTGVRDYFDVIKNIVDHKGDVNSQVNGFGNSPFHLLFKGKCRDLTIIKFFLDSKGNPNLKYKSDLKDISGLQSTPFESFFKHYDSDFQVDYEILNLFFEHKADPNTILAKSVELSEHSDDLKLLRFLFDKGADPNIDREAMKMVCESDYINEHIVALFLDHKMNPLITFSQKFLYEEVFEKEKRNMLAYAIPLYIKPHYMSLLTSFLLCLKCKKKTCTAFNIPKPVVNIINGYLLKELNQVFEEIKKIEDKTYWYEEDHLDLKNAINQLIHYNWSFLCKRWNIEE